MAEPQNSWSDPVHHPSLDAGGDAAIACAAEVLGRRIARHLAATLPAVLEKNGLLAVVTASGVGAAVLAAARQLGNLQFPVSGIVLGALDHSPEPLQEEILRCRAFKVPVRECQNERDLEFVRSFPGLRLVAVDLQEEITRHSELRDGLLEEPCIDLWTIRQPVTDLTMPWYRRQALPGWDAETAPSTPDAGNATVEFQPLITVADPGPPTAPFTGFQGPPLEPQHAAPALPPGPPPGPPANPQDPPNGGHGGPPEPQAGSLRHNKDSAPPPPPNARGMAAPASLGGSHPEIDRYIAQHWAPLTRYFTPVAVTRETARLLDSRAIREFKMTGLRMMELAAFQAAEIAALMARPFVTSADHRVAVICGLGNNGGDGYVVARYLACWGLPVDVYLVGDRAKILDDARTNLLRLERLRENFVADEAARRENPHPEWRKAALGDLITPGWTRTGPTLAFAPLPELAADLEIVPVDSLEAMQQNQVALQHAALIVDALLGTGMHGEVRGINRDAIAWINAAVPPRPAPSGAPAGTPPPPPPPPGESEPHVPVLSLDTPSGIDASTGAVLGSAVHANVTVTFGAPKVGLSQRAPSPDGPRHAGKVILAEISWPLNRNRGW